jgi:hypothetical protein
VKENDAIAATGTEANDTNGVPPLHVQLRLAVIISPLPASWHGVVSLLWHRRLLAVGTLLP